MVKADWTNNEFLRPASTSLVKTKDGHLKGAIGELIAWKYLKRHCWVWSVAPTWPSFLLVDTALKNNFYLKSRQLNYLKHHIRTGKHRWDFLAIRDREIYSKNIETRYLVEVKTGLLGSFHPTIYYPNKTEYMKTVAEAKSFGFTPILVEVRMGDDWTFHVSFREL